MCHSELSTNDYDRGNQPLPDTQANAYCGPLPHVDLLSSPRQAHQAPDVVMSSPSVSQVPDALANSHPHPRSHTSSPSIYSRRYSTATPTSQARSNKLEPFGFEWDADGCGGDEFERNAERDNPDRDDNGSPNKFWPSLFEWDEDDSGVDVSDKDWDEYRNGWDPYDDDDRLVDGRSPPSSSSQGRSSSPEPDAEWDEHHGWSPYNDSGENLDKPATPRSQPHSSERNDDEPLCRQYHKYINGK